MRKTLAFVGVAFVLLSASAHAKSVTLDFEGSGWGFNDHEWKFLGCGTLPEQCSFWEGLAAIGVTEGSSIYWSLTFDDSLPPLDTFGTYSALRGEVTIGRNSYALISPTFSLAPSGSIGMFNGMTGPSLPPSNGLALVPGFFQFGYSSAGLMASQLSLIDWTNPSLFTSSSSNLAFVGFNPGNNIGIVQPRLISVRVPEQTSLRMLMSGLLVLMVFSVTRPSRSARNST